VDQLKIDMCHQINLKKKKFRKKYIFKKKKKTWGNYSQPLGTMAEATPLSHPLVPKGVVPPPVKVHLKRGVDLAAICSKTIIKNSKPSWPKNH
jgi:hypothetical protein